MDNIIKLSIELDHNEIPEHYNARSGVIIVVVEENITIEGIDGKLIERVKGKMSSEKKTINPFTLTRSTQVLYKGETYRFPFELQQTSDLETYTGKNFSVFYELEFKIELEQSSYDRLKKGFVKNIKSFFTGEKYHKKTLPIVFEQPRTRYEIVESSGDFVLTQNFTLLTILLVVFLGLSFLIFSTRVEFIIIGVVLGLIFGVFLQKIIIKSLMGKFSLELIQEENETFLAIVQSNNNWNFISTSSLRYRVIEEVVDRRGTSTSTYSETLFSSKTIELSSNAETRKAVFPFPNRHFPMVKVKDASILWLMELKLQTTFGLEFKLEKDFQLKK